MNRVRGPADASRNNGDDNSILKRPGAESCACREFQRRTIKTRPGGRSATTVSRWSEVFGTAGGERVVSAVERIAFADQRPLAQLSGLLGQVEKVVVHRRHGRFQCQQIFRQQLVVFDDVRFGVRVLHDRRRFVT